MTDRYIALTVILDREIREDDAEPLINAIRMLKGVAGVKPQIADGPYAVAYERARYAMRQEVMDLLQQFLDKR